MATMTNDTDNDHVRRVDENARWVLRELIGMLSGKQLDREPPVSPTEDGEIEGLQIAIDEMRYAIDHGEVRPPGDDHD